MRYSFFRRSPIGYILLLVAVLIIFGILYGYRRLRGDNSEQAKNNAQLNFSKGVKILLILLIFAIIAYTLIDSFA